MPRHRRGRPPPSHSSTKPRRSGLPPAHTGATSNASSRQAAQSQGDGIAHDETCHQVTQAQRGDKGRRVLKWTGLLVLGTVIREAAEVAVDWIRAAVPWDSIPWGDIWPW